MGGNQLKQEIIQIVQELMANQARVSADFQNEDITKEQMKLNIAAIAGEAVGRILDLVQ